MTTLDSEPDDRRLCEITHFSSYRPLEVSHVRLTLETLPTHSPVLGDNRWFKDFGPPTDEPNALMTRWTYAILNMD